MEARESDVTSVLATTSGHRTVGRVMSILEAAARTGSGLTLAALCAQLDAPKSSVHGLVRGLVAMGYLQESAGGYVIGPAVGLLTMDQPAAFKGARPALERLSQASGESATLARMVGETVIYLDHVPSKHVVRYAPPLGVRRPLYPTSSGKCFLAWMPAARRQRYVRANYPDPDQARRVLADLDAVAARGYATNLGETVPDVFAVASPIVIRGQAVACVQVAGPERRMRDRMQELAGLVVAAAHDLSPRQQGA